MSPQDGKLTPEQWASVVSDVLANQPELVAITVAAIQDGVLRAQDRLRSRILDVSLGLVEAINTKLNHVRRNHDVIVAAIEASTVSGSSWARDAIERERA